MDKEKGDELALGQRPIDVLQWNLRKVNLFSLSPRPNNPNYFNPTTTELFSEVSINNPIPLALNSIHLHFEYPPPPTTPRIFVRTIRMPIFVDTN